MGWKMLPAAADLSNQIAQPEFNLRTSPQKWTNHPNCLLKTRIFSSKGRTYMYIYKAFP
jgi:hypothetical protein